MRCKMYQGNLVLTEIVKYKSWVLEMNRRADSYPLEHTGVRERMKGVLQDAFRELSSWYNYVDLKTALCDFSGKTYSPDIYSPDIEMAYRGAANIFSQCFQTINALKESLRNGS